MSLKKVSSCIATIALAILLSSSPSQATRTATQSQNLSDAQRRSLRYHLENLYNEFDLLIRNQKVDEFDLTKQARTISGLKIYERIPFSPLLQELKTQVIESAKEAQIQIRQFKIREGKYPDSKTSIVSAPSQMPKTHSIRGGYFSPKPGQFIREHSFELLVNGSPTQIESWTHSWKEQLMRLVEIDRLERLPPGHNSKFGQYRIRAHTFQFKKVDFPKIIPPRPLEYLPEWAQKNPDSFSQKEPVLWDFVIRSEKLRPLTPPLYRKRERFLMTAARIDFFLSKARP